MDKKKFIDKYNEKDFQDIEIPTEEVLKIIDIIAGARDYNIETCTDVIKTLTDIAEIIFYKMLNDS